MDARCRNRAVVTSVLALLLLPVIVNLLLPELENARNDWRVNVSLLTVVALVGLLEYFRCRRKEQNKPSEHLDGSED